MRTRLTAIPLLVSLTLVASPLLAQESAEIVVAGTGEVRVAPDRATVLFTIETRASQARAAAEDNAGRQERVLAALDDAGVERDSLSTISYGVQPEWQWREGERHLTGYLAQTTIRVRTDELDRVGSLVDTALKAGVNRVDDIRFELSDPEAARRDALSAAVRNARAAAQAMAAAAGGALGRLRVLTTEDDGAAPRPAPRMERALAVSAQEAETQVVPAEQTVRASVVGRWEFIPAGSRP